MVRYFICPLCEKDSFVISKKTEKSNSRWTNSRCGVCSFTFFFESDLEELVIKWINDQLTTGATKEEDKKTADDFDRATEIEITKSYKCPICREFKGTKVTKCKKGRIENQACFKCKDCKVTIFIRPEYLYVLNLV